MDKEDPKTQYHQIILAFDLTTLNLMATQSQIFLRLDPMVNGGLVSLRLGLLLDHPIKIIYIRWVVLMKQVAPKWTTQRWTTLAIVPLFVIVGEHIAPVIQHNFGSLQASVMIF